MLSRLQPVIGLRGGQGRVEARRPFDEVPDRAEVRRHEGGRTCAVRLAHVPRGVDLVQERDEHAATRAAGAAATCSAASRFAGPSAPGERRVAHRAGDDERDVVLPDRVDEEGGLFEGVGALREHNADGAARDCAARRLDRLEDVGEGERTALRRHRIVSADFDRHWRERCDEVGAGQSGHDAAGFACHRDRAAEREERDVRHLAPRDCWRPSAGPFGPIRSLRIVPRSGGKGHKPATRMSSQRSSHEPDRQRR